jgi:hypothetical protein
MSNIHKGKLHPTELSGLPEVESIALLYLDGFNLRAHTGDFDYDILTMLLRSIEYGADDERLSVLRGLGQLALKPVLRSEDATVVVRHDVGQASALVLFKKLDQKLIGAEDDSNSSATDERHMKYFIFPESVGYGRLHHFPRVNPEKFFIAVLAVAHARFSVQFMDDAEQLPHIRAVPASEIDAEILANLGYVPLDRESDSDRVVMVLPPDTLKEFRGA